ncbi:MAG: lytic transglycosylase domain-containing protein [Spirochaetaceae bacterium]|nr:lytic transglycosylase domain-containing protein [Spirochaetaceae bacterium]
MPLVACTACKAQTSTENQEKLLEILNDSDFDALDELVSPSSFTSTVEPDSCYYTALHLLNNGGTERAIELLQYGKTHASWQIAQECARKLCSLGTTQEREASAKYFAEAYPQERDADFYILEELFNQKKYKEALKACPLPALADFAFPQDEQKAKSETQKKRIKQNLEAQNKKTKYQLLCLLKTKNPKFTEYFTLWVNNWNISEEHESFLKFWEELPQEEKDAAQIVNGQNPETLAELLQFRVTVKQKKYKQALLMLAALPYSPENFTSKVFSDFGRAELYGGVAAKEGASTFRTIAEKTKDPDIAFLAWFYCAQFSVNEKNFDAALNAFVLSMHAAPTPAKYDNALWYYLKTAKTVSLEAAKDALKTYASTWQDPEYFEDFLRDLAADLLQGHYWDDFVEIYKLIQDYADPNSQAQYAYVSGRLIEETMAKNPFEGMGRLQAAQACYEKAYDGNHTALYYRFLSAEQLGIPIEENIEKNSTLQFERDKALETLAIGYAEHALFDEAYKTYMAHYHDIGIECASELSRIFSRAAEKDCTLHYDALSIINRAASRSDATLSKEVLYLLYPRPYLSEVKNAAETFGVNEDVLFGLIRTESYFDKTIASRAGATGLAQLMDATANDIAKKLKIKEFDLKDAQTNVNFGAYYLNNLTGRLDNSIMMALFAYNGGIARVRRWQKAAKDLPVDLFLETIPFLETRDYGRKVLSAAALYGYLYYNKTVHQVVQEIIGTKPQIESNKLNEAQNEGKSG